MLEAIKLNIATCQRREAGEKKLLSWPPQFMAHNFLSVDICAI